MSGELDLTVAPVVKVLLAAIGCLFSPIDTAKAAEPPQQARQVIGLPAAETRGEVPVEQALQLRRSIRSFGPKALTLDRLAQLLWAAQGVSGGTYRTAPSAGATYPLQVYAAVGNVGALAAGVYRYEPAEHALILVREGDVLAPLARAAYGQDWIADAPVAIVLSAVYGRTTGRYGERGVRYVHMEAGHAAQNVYLQAEALELGTVVVGAFADGSVRKVLHLDEEEQPLLIMPVGKAKY